MFLRLTGSWPLLSADDNIGLLVNMSLPDGWQAPHSNLSATAQSECQCIQCWDDIHSMTKGRECQCIQCWDNIHSLTKDRECQGIQCRDDIHSMTKDRECQGIQCWDGLCSLTSNIRSNARLWLVPLLALLLANRHVGRVVCPHRRPCRSGRTQHH